MVLGLWRNTSFHSGRKRSNWSTDLARVMREERIERVLELEADGMQQVASSSLFGVLRQPVSEGSALLLRYLRSGQRRDRHARCPRARVPQAAFQSLRDGQPAQWTTDQSGAELYPG